MKKVLLLVALFTTVYSTNSFAQQRGNNDPAAMMQRYRERIKPMLIEKTNITDAQADKVLDINFAARQQMRGLRELGEDERKQKMSAIQADIDKQYKAIPLTDDQIKAVDNFFEEQRKAMQERRQQQGGGQ